MGTTVKQIQLAVRWDLKLETQGLPLQVPSSDCSARLSPKKYSMNKIINKVKALSGFGLFPCLYLLHCNELCTLKYFNFNFLVFIYLYIYLFGQKCCFCGRFGASIVCEMPDCGRIYHYPCAMAARTYQVRAKNISLPILFDKVEQKYRDLSVASEILINLFNQVQ